MSNARNISGLGSLISHVSNLIGLSNNKANIDAAAAGSVPAGTLVDFAGASAPSGWLIADGSAISRTTYASLFTAIGTTHGVGNGTTTFNLPDARGRVIAGLGGSTAGRLTSGASGINGDTLGASGGSEVHTLTSAQMPSHSHTGTTDAGGAHTPTVSTSSTAGAGTRVAQGSTLTGNVNANAVPDHTHTFTTATTGTGASHNNTQPTLVLNKIIKT